MSRPEWNNRFFVSESRNNRKVHEYFRQYFDKSERSRQTRISFPDSPSKFYPNLRSSLEKYSKRIPKLSKLGIKDKKTLELGWNSDFQVKVSKDNQHFYKSYREYFDSPKIIDHSKAVMNPIPLSAHGFSKTVSTRHESANPRSEWAEVYTPISENNISKYKTLRNYFQPALKDLSPAS